MTSDEPRRFRTREELDDGIDDFIRQRTDPKCDVPACRRRWTWVRKLGWSDGLQTTVISYFLCPKHLKMPQAKLLKEAPTRIPALDDAPNVKDVAPHN
jgi:hypothetical protein